MPVATRALVADYATAVSDGDFDRLSQLVQPDATFGGTVLNGPRECKCSCRASATSVRSRCAPMSAALWLKAITLRSSTTSSPIHLSGRFFAQSS